MSERGDEIERRSACSQRWSRPGLASARWPGELTCVRLPIAMECARRGDQGARGAQDGVLSSRHHTADRSDSTRHPVFISIFLFRLLFVFTSLYARLRVSLSAPHNALTAHSSSAHSILFCTPAPACVRWRVLTELARASLLITLFLSLCSSSLHTASSTISDAFIASSDRASSRLEVMKQIISVYCRQSLQCRLCA